MNSADLGFSVLCVVWILEKLESLHYINSGTYVYAVRALCVNCIQLVDMQWSLGMSMASSNCRNLNSPFVSVLLKVAESSGTVTEQSFEMTLPEFKVSI